MNELFRKLLALPPQASTTAPEIDAFHYVVIGISMIGAAAVAIAVAVFLLRFGERSGHKRRPGAIPAARKPPPVSLEIGVIAGLFGLFIAFWVVGFRQFVRIRTPPPGAIEIYVVGKQWMWSFAYPDGTVSNYELRVPVGQPVKLVMTSRDVIHSFFVPAFRVKQDVVPGQMTTMWFEASRPGVYEVLCAEYCGASHSMMRGRVVALPPDEYAEWQGLQAAEVDLARLGERVAGERGCLRCHTLDGRDHIGPSFAGLYGARVPLADGGEVVADEAYLTRSMMDPLVELHRGYPPVMPSYLGQLTAAETGALVELIRSLRDVSAPSSPPAAVPGVPAQGDRR